MKTKLYPNSPIGVFDSGLGGLTVLKSLIKILPNESFIYFGDTAHVPYGSKSTDTIIKYSQSILNFFTEKNTKAVVIACNTASAVANDILKQQYSMPLFDVVTPSVDLTIKQSKTKQVGIIGTASTIKSKAYSKKFKEKNKKISIYEISCPLFVPLIEEGWDNSPIAKQIANIYLNDFKKQNIDYLILGCTHYPIMANTIKSVLHDNIKMIFSGNAVGIKLFEYLKLNNLMNTSPNKTTIEFYVSDDPQKFNDLGSRFFGTKFNNVQYLLI